jgi:hypothetical protein
LEPFHTKSDESQYEFVIAALHGHRDSLLRRFSRRRRSTTSSPSPGACFVNQWILFPLSHPRTCSAADGASIKVWKWLRSMIEHEIHHRGQIYIYLSLLETPGPPLYGLTSEQVQERSFPP